MKNEPLDRILGAIREIHAGWLVASPAITGQLLAEALGMPHPAPAAGASPQQGLSLAVLNLRPGGENLGDSRTSGIEQNDGAQLPGPAHGGDSGSVAAIKSP